MQHITFGLRAEAAASDGQRSLLSTHKPARAKSRLWGVLAVGLLAGPMAANALSFSCINGTATNCALATSTLSWSWNGLDFTIANGGSGYVSEVYFDLSAGMSVSFFGGTGGNVFFYAGANPANLPGGGSVSFVSDASFDSDPAGNNFNGINAGETATFRIVGASLNSFANGSLTGGVHERSLVDGSAGLITTTRSTVPEPGTLALLGLGLLGLGISRRKKA